MAKLTGRTKLALWLMIAPTVLLVLSLFIYAITNWIFATVTPEAVTSSTLFGSEPVGIMIINVILFIFGVVGIISWLPGLITGIVLLATAKK